MVLAYDKRFFIRSSTHGKAVKGLIIYIFDRKRPNLLVTSII